ncbi:MAG: hypothetical protein CO164_00065 [Rhodocyclales bacterium CG_4_9_14_3_um_filter_68_10]|nr:MAG: hypothetical protein CO164_00065 [Rhodocyclales bacterium CG_4_9_14_3_um_filter_68_10]
MRARADSLARYLAAAYAAVVVYASLYPFAGWRDGGAPILAWLTAGWPRYATGFDLATNVAAYVPLGWLAVAAIGRRLRPGAAAALAWACASLLSFGMESAQNFLPSRVSSNVDFGCNLLGALGGCALGLRYRKVLAEGGAIARWRARRFPDGRLGELGLLLIAVWLLTQLNPENPALGNGSLLRLLGLSAPLAYDGELFFALELLIAATGVMGAGLTAWMSLREPSVLLLVAAFIAAAAAKALAWAVLVEPSAWLAWLTPGARPGLALGAAGLALALWLPRPAQVSLAVLALLAMTALTNLAPGNPYLAWAGQGHFLNFNGLTRIASSLWPFLAAAYLLALPARRR